MRRKNEPLTPEQERAIAAYASGANIAETAKAAGVNRVTLWHWRRDDVFARAWADARSKANGELLTAAQDLTQSAINRAQEMIDLEWSDMDRDERMTMLKLLLGTPYVRRSANDGAVQRSEHTEVKIEWNRAPVAFVDGDVTRTYEPPARALPADDAEVESADDSPDEIPPDVQ